MTIAQAVGGAFALLFITASTWTAFRLLRMAHRTKRSPELLMGLGLLGTGTLGFGLTVAAAAFESSAPRTGDILRLSSTVAVSGASIAFAIFTRNVFRRGEAWANALVTGVLMGLAGLLFVSLRSFWLPGPARFDPAMLARGIVLSLVWGWMGVECIRYRATMRRRLAIGLADPVVVNRFSLWCFVSIESFILTAISTGASAVSGGRAMNTDGMIMLVSALGMSGALAIYLAFMPPPAYMRWIAGPAATKA